jgi:tRNA (cytidine/uridine-2'-O-)-methyltransferase
MRSFTIPAIVQDRAIGEAISGLSQSCKQPICARLVLHCRGRLSGPVRIALYQPEIPGNVGAILRLAACLQVAVDIIEPCGFIWSDARVRRAGMDYIDHVSVVRHSSWGSFVAAATGRLVLLSSKASTRLPDFAFAHTDVLLLGQESAGVPDQVRAHCPAQVRIPLNAQVRSLNVAVAAGIALGEGLRQTEGWPA